MKGGKTARSRKNLEGLVSSMGGCVPGCVGKLVQAATDYSQEAAVIASCAAICAIDPGGPNCEEVYRPALDALASASVADGPAALEHFAAHAQNGRIKLEAVRRLGPVASIEGGRPLLRKLAKEGFTPSHSFRNERVPSESFRIAALESIGRINEPTEEDVAAVLAVLTEEAQASTDSEIFTAAVEAMFAVAREGDVDSLIAIIQERWQPRMTLRLLSVLSKFDRQALTKHQPTIARLLCSHLGQGYESKQALCERLKTLARTVSGADLTRAILEGSPDCLDNGKGAILAAALEARDEVDAQLTNAYLKFARESCNATRNSQCVKGLKRCAEGGKVDAIVTSLVQQRHTGYEELVKKGLLKEIVGSVSSVVDLVCKAMGTITDQSQISRCAETACIGLLAIAQKGAEDPVNLHHVEDARTDSQRYYRDDREMERLAEAVKACPSQENAVAILARRVCSTSPLPGAVPLAQWFLIRDDELARLFAETLFKAAGHLRLKRPGALPPDSPLVKVEESLPRLDDRWVRAQLEKLVVINGKLTRYVMDLLGRKGILLASAGQKALGMARSTDDAAFILESLALVGSPECLQVLGRSTGFDSSQSKLTAGIRIKAIEIVGNCLSRPGSPRNEQTDAFLLAQVHGRFVDSQNVRMAAYGVCKRLARPESIKELRERLETDTDSEAKAAIRDALGSIGKQLMGNRPTHADIDASITWLRYVGELGDQAFSAQVGDYLSAPHSDPKVLVEALKCLEALRDGGSIETIEGFLAEVSPSGEVLRAARHAKAILQGRKDVELTEALAEIFQEGSVVLAPETDYEKILGLARVKRFSKHLHDALKEQEDGRWDSFVCRIRAICEMLIRVLFEKHSGMMGLEERKSRNLAVQDYGNLLEVSAFKNSFPDIRPPMLTIYELRRESTTPHLEDRDGSEKTGNEEPDARLAMQEFQRLFPQYVKRVWEWLNRPPETDPSADSAGAKGPAFP